jgi:uncharacterized membrane protein
MINLLFFLPPLFWGINTTIEKYYLLNFFKPFELVLLRGVIIFILFILYSFYQKDFIKKCSTFSLEKYIIIIITSLLTVSSMIIYYKVLKNNKTAFTVAFISSFWAIFATFFSYLFYNETINPIQILGLIFVTMGLFMINYLQ